MRLIYEKAYFDYTEIINLAVQFLEGTRTRTRTSTVRGHVRDDIRYVVVDEYQDVNPLQERLVRGLTQFGANLCVVGDDDQTIYQWRGSEVSNIVTFADRYAGVHQVTLAENFRSSEGVVEVGKSIAERIPAGERLPKAMVRAGHQSWTRGDLIARDFADEDEEAAWICDRIEAMRGLAFNDTADGEARGLSWSDFAVLFRSVAKDADPLVAEMRRRDIPYVVKGLNRLFDSPEITAVVGVFRYMAGLVEAPDLRALWQDANLLPASGDWAAALAVLDEGRDFDRGERWGVYNIQRLYLEFLAALGLREETVPGDPVRRELVFYQLGKFSQAISDFEAIYFNTEPAQKYEAFAKLARVPGSRLLRGVGRRRRVRDARRGHAHDRASGQGDAMACGLHSLPPQEPIPVEAARRARPLPRHPGSRDRRCRPLPRHGRGRDAAVLRRSHTRGEVPVRVVLARPEPALQEAVGLLRPLCEPAVVLDQGHWRAGGRAAARAPGPPRDAGSHALVFGVEVPVRVPVPVQAALPLRLQPAAARSARLREGSA